MTYQTNILLLFIFQVFFNIIFLFKLKNISKIINIFDIPNQRKKHLYPVPLLGGIIIFYNIIILFSISYLLKIELEIFNKFSFLFGYISFFFLGLYDDKYQIKASIKLLLSIIILIPILLYDPTFKIDSLRLSFYTGELILGNYDIFITILFILLFINAFNMFDGINCQNGIYSIILIIFLISLSKNNIFLYGLLFSIVVFNLYNFRNKFFLGDSGSLSLGFLFSYFYIMNYNNNLIIYSDAIYLIMYLPGIELMRLYIFRVLNKKSPFKPDRNHLHHYFLESHGYNKTIIIISCLIALPVISSFYFDNKILLINIVFLLLYLYFIFFKFRNNFKI